MKLLIVYSLAFMSTLSMACTDFSGDYQTAEQTYYSITQKQCESMDVIDQAGTNKMIFDGVERLIYDYDLIVEGQLIAHIQVFLNSKMESEKGIYNEKDVYVYPNGKTETEIKWAEVSLNEESNLLTVLHKADGSTETFVDIRSK